jgi:hypothetical protein
LGASAQTSAGRIFINRGRLLCPTPTGGRRCGALRAARIGWASCIRCRGLLGRTGWVGFLSFAGPFRLLGVAVVAGRLIAVRVGVGCVCASIVLHGGVG